MKKISIVLLSVFAMYSCSKTQEEKSYTKAELDRIIDSTTQAKIKAAEIAAAEDLAYRQTIELKSRMDSIKNAKNTKKEKK